MTKLSTSRRRTLNKSLWDPNGGNKCFYCNQEVKRKDRSLDHLIPHSRGGTTDKNNIVLACRSCNNAKADFTLAEFVDFVAQQGGIERVKEVWGGNALSKRHLRIDIK